MQVVSVDAAAQIKATRELNVNSAIDHQTLNESLLNGQWVVGSPPAELPASSGLGWTSPNWFNVQFKDVQTAADAIFADIKTCNAQTNPKQALVKAARDSHSKCRAAELAMVGMNLTKDCEDTKKSDCDEMQSTFELAMCTHSESQVAFCAEVEACHMVASHVTKKTLVTWKESNLKEEFVHYKQFECRINKWPLNQDEKQHCKDLQPDSSHLSVSYPSQPISTPCAKITMLPGDAAWLALEYSSKPWSKLAKEAMTCAPAPAPNTVLESPKSKWKGNIGKDCMIQNFTTFSHPPHCAYNNLQARDAAATKIFREEFESGSWAAVWIDAKNGFGQLYTDEFTGKALDCPELPDINGGSVSAASTNSYGVGTNTGQHVRGKVKIVARDIQGEENTCTIKSQYAGLPGCLKEESMASFPQGWGDEATTWASCD